MKSKKGVVIKSVGGVFTVADENDVNYVCFSPKKFRHNQSDVIVGDAVTFEDIKRGKGVICDVLPRKNKLSRPEIANVDVCFIVLACEPEPDFYLADKVLINCFQQKIEPVIVVNKSDLSSNLLQIARQNYESVTDVICVSAFDESVKVLRDYLNDGKVACFAGQSAVGKTSLLNALIPDFGGKVGNLSDKTGRGTHTTRQITLRKLSEGFLADTCGFSLCDFTDIDSSDLRLYLDDFVTLSSACKFSSCTHTVEPDCAVRNAYNNGTIFKERYERYVEEYNELVERESLRYR